MPITFITGATYKFKHARWGEFSGCVLEKRGDHVHVRITAGTVSFASGSLRGPGRTITLHLANIESAEEQ